MRISELLKLPLILTPAMSLPEVFVFNAVGFMLIYYDMHVDFDNRHSIGVHHAVSQYRSMAGSPFDFLPTVNQWLDITAKEIINI